MAEALASLSVTPDSAGNDVGRGSQTFRDEHHLVLAFIGLHFLVCGVVAAMTGTWLVWLALGVPAVLFPAWMTQTYPSAFLSRLVVSAACMAFTLLGVQQTRGYMEAHFSFFVMITILAVYRDWRILIFAAALVVVHHVGFTISNPKLIGFYDRSHSFGAWRHVLSHLAVGLLQVFTLCYLTILLRRREVLNASLGSSLVRATKRANHDQLTGLFNRNHLEDVVAQLSSEGEGVRAEAILCLIDLDHFKTINDKHGHAAGDDVLRAVAKTIHNQIRPDDWAIRLGGEEFLVVLLDSAIDDGCHFAERIRSHVASLIIPISKAKIAVTISIGVAAWRSNESFEETLKRADEALYRAKGTGRNRVEVWSDADGWTAETIAA